MMRFWALDHDEIAWILRGRVTKNMHSAMTAEKNLYNFAIGRARQDELSASSLHRLVNMCWRRIHSTYHERSERHIR